MALGASSTEDAKTSPGDVQEILQEFQMNEPNTKRVRRGLRFWLIFLAIAVAMYEAAFELCAIGIALPSITEDLKALDFVWVGSAYALSSSCALPMSGGLAQAFGRRHVMVGSLVVFAIGAVICGAAKNMNMLIAGRTIQGIGGGGILSLPSIILSDLVSLKERGAYNGLLGITWSVAIATSAVIGGALSGAGKWRWIFYMNVPISAVSLALVLGFLRTPTPKGSISSKLKQLDWIGNFIIIASTCSCSIALTWAGVRYSWSSPQVLVPLCLGLAGMVFFVYYEIAFATTPLIPFHLLSNRTSIIGYLATFLNALIVITSIYYFPPYLQACKGDSPVQAGGIDWLGVSLTVGPFGIVAGVSVVLLNRYRPSIYFAWMLIIVGLGLWTRLDIHSSRAMIGGLQAIFGLGIGAIYTTTYFPVLAPLPVQANARALAFFNFCRSFGQVWGVTIGASVLQNELLHRLPSEFVAQLPQGVSLAFSAIPHIAQLPEPLRTSVRQTFADSVRVVWIIVLAIASVGGICLLFMKEVKMHEYTDSDWGIEENKDSMHPSDGA